ncbi:MAG: CBS domain-containing protein [Candidatus Hecatellaceae archaeon]
MKRIAEIPVSEMASEPLVIDGSEALTKAVGLMKQAEAYEILVRLGEGKLGILTTRTILSRSFPLGMKVKGLAEQVPLLSPEDPVGKAAALMSQFRFRSLPIVEKGKLIGALESRSILRRMADVGVPKLKARHVMARGVVSISWGETIGKARRLMVNKRIDHLPVLRRGKPAGILTSTHIVYNLYPTEAETVGEWVGETERMLKAPVGSFADPNLLTCGLDEPVQQVVKRMLDQHSTYIVAEFIGEIHGIITFRDLVALIPEPVSHEIPLYIMGLPEDPFEAEAAKLKFMRVLSLLSKGVPNILEARSMVKTSSKKEGGRQRYEVDVHIVTPKQTYTYRDSGWDLAQIYDNIVNRVKRILTDRRRRRAPGLRGEGI